MNHFLKSIISLFAGLALFLAIQQPGLAQVDIVPIAQYMDDDNKTTRMVVRNASDQPVELHMELLYGYPATNERGEIYVKLIDDIPAHAPSAVSWIRIYPRHTVLPPGRQQTIRFAARPPSSLSDGEYWARPAVSARKLDQRNSPGASTGDFQANLNLVRRTILSLNYRRGDVKTGVTIDDISHLQRHDTLSIQPRLSRTGNAAYLGHLEVRLLDDGGTQIRKQRQEVAVYHKLSPKISFELNNVPPGTYRLNLSLSTRDRHHADENILEASPVRRSTTIPIK